MPKEVVERANAGLGYHELEERNLLASIEFEGVDGGGETRGALPITKSNTIHFARPQPKGLGSWHAASAAIRITATVLRRRPLRSACRGLWLGCGERFHGVLDQRG